MGSAVSLLMGLSLTKKRGVAKANHREPPILFLQEDVEEEHEKLTEGVEDTMGEAAEKYTT